MRYPVFGKLKMVSTSDEGITGGERMVGERSWSMAWELGFDGEVGRRR